MLIVYFNDFQSQNPKFDYNLFRKYAPKILLKYIIFHQNRQRVYKVSEKMVWLVLLQNPSFQNSIPPPPSGRYFDNYLHMLITLCTELPR